MKKEYASSTYHLTALEKEKIAMIFEGIDYTLIFRSLAIFAISGSIPMSILLFSKASKKLKHVAMLIWYLTPVVLTTIVFFTSTHYK